MVNNGCWEVKSLKSDYWHSKQVAMVNERGWKPKETVVYGLLKIPKNTRITILNFPDFEKIWGYPGIPLGPGLGLSYEMGK